MYTPRHIFENTYVWFFGERKDAERTAVRFTRWRQIDHAVVQVGTYGYLVRNVHNKLFDVRGRLPDDLFTVNPEENVAFPVVDLTGS